ncbi:MAG: aspartate kinase [Nitrososphaerota archaeon]
MRIVMKFGGSILKDKESILNIAKTIHEYSKENELVIVVSALKGVTDYLIKISEEAINGNEKIIKEKIIDLRKKHLEIIEETIKNENIKKEIERIIEELINELEKFLIGVTYLREITPRIKDYILSFGERLSTPIIYGILKDVGLKVEYYSGGEAGIITDSNFGEAKPLMNVTKYQIRERILPLLDKKIIPIISGFIAFNQEGMITTLGRGGSDYTATIIGSAIKADETWIWTDVDGLMTADPKIVPFAKTLHELSFLEAIEMAVFGAKYMHPKALEPAMEENIPVRIRNLFNQENPGTLITKEVKIIERKIVKAVTSINDVALITVSGIGMIGTPGIAAKIFDTLGKNNINILMISQSVSEANISLIIKRKDLERAITAFETSIFRKDFIQNIETEEDISVIAVVGAGMKGTPGVAARVFNAVAKKGVNVRMIAQGSSELNISFVVKEKDSKKAVQAIHEEFELDKL